METLKKVLFFLLFLFQLAITFYLYMLNAAKKNQQERQTKSTWHTTTNMRT